MMNILLSCILATFTGLLSSFNIKKCGHTYVFGTTRNCSSEIITATTIAQTTPMENTVNSTASPQRDSGNTTIIIISCFTIALILILLLVFTYMKRGFIVAFIIGRLNTAREQQDEDEELTSV